MRQERKHEVAEEYFPKDPNFTGVFLILVSCAPAPVWGVQCTKSGKFVKLAKKYPYVNHYSFHVLDPEWGHVTIKMSGHPPFGAQIMLNGHEYVACQTRKEGLQFIKEGNCFTQISDTTRLTQIADTLSSPDILGRLRQVGEGAQTRPGRSKKIQTWTKTEISKSRGSPLCKPSH